MSTPKASETPQIGRPKSGKCRAAAMEATTRLLGEISYSKLSFERVAREAGISKQTIYNCWESKAKLVMAAYLQRAELTIREPDTGDVSSDIEILLTDACRSLRQKGYGSGLAAVLVEAQTDPELAKEFRDTFIGARRKVGERLLRRGIARGELPIDLPVIQILDLMYGPLWYRLLIRTAPLSDKFAKDHAALVLRAARAKERPAKTRSSTAKRTPVALALMMCIGVSYAGTSHAAEAAPATVAVDTAQVTRMSFDVAMRTAAARNPAVRSTALDVERARALLAQARAASLPSVAGNAIYTHLDGDRLVNGRIAQAQDSISATLGLAVPLVQLSRWGAWRRASDVAELAEQMRAVTRRDVVLTAARAYIGVLREERIREVAERANKIGEEHFNFADARLKGGVGSKLDVVRAAQEVQDTATALARQQVACARAREALGVALGVDHPVDAENDATLSFVPTAVRIEERPDLRALKRGADNAERAKADEWREYMPTLSGAAQVGYQDPPTLTVPLTNWQAQLILSLPVFDGGLREGVVRERDAAAEQAKIRYEDALRRARADVRVAEAQVRAAEDTLVKARKTVELARESANLARQGYEGGVSTGLELMDADRRARDAETQYALSEDTLRQARLDWAAAAGPLGDEAYAK